MYGEVGPQKRATVTHPLSFRQEVVQHAPANPMTARSRGDKHALDLQRGIAPVKECDATRWCPIQPRQSKSAPRWPIAARKVGQFNLKPGKDAPVIRLQDIGHDPADMARTRSRRASRSSGVSAWGTLIISGSVVWFRGNVLVEPLPRSTQRSRIRRISASPPPVPARSCASTKPKLRYNGSASVWRVLTASIICW